VKPKKNGGIHDDSRVAADYACHSEIWLTVAPVTASEPPENTLNPNAEESLKTATPTNPIKKKIKFSF
jgi:hypothetical protein